MAEGALPELARLGPTDASGHAISRARHAPPGRLPAAPPQRRLRRSLDSFQRLLFYYLFFLRQLIAARESRRNENWQKRADIRFIHHPF